MSERLTNDIRGKIVNAVLKHKYASRANDIRHEMSGLAFIAYTGSFTKEEHKIIASLPNGWLPVSSVIKFAVGEKIFSIRFNGVDGRDDALSWLYLSKHYDDCSQRFPHHKNGTIVKKFEDENTIGERVSTVLEKRAEIIKEINADRERLTGIIGKHTTIKKLIDSWPEIEPFIPVNEKPKPKLPALPVADLNAHFELPVE